MYFAVYNPTTKELISIASEIDEKVIQDKALEYKTYQGDDSDAGDKVWDKVLLDFVPSPEPVLKSKGDLIAEIEADLGLTKEQVSKLLKHI